MKNNPRFIEPPFGMSTFSGTLTVSDIVLKVWIQIYSIQARSTKALGRELQKGFKDHSEHATVGQQGQTLLLNHSP